MAGIYIHIPFCKQACYYCNFHFSTTLKQKNGFLEALLKEIALQNNYLQGQMVETVYFGGGTPSLLTADELKLILAALHQHFTIDGLAEITLEANPDDITNEKLNHWKTAGINRLSIGVQSFFEEDLQLMNRAHSAQQATDCISRSQEAGFTNFTIDLIYGSPTLTDEKWKQNVDKAIQYSIPHLSCYALTVEPGTALQTMIKRNQAPVVNTDDQARQFLLLMAWLEQAGYDQYEISNFALSGRRSRHNSAYWQGKHYLGLGPSAHSFNGTSRQWNVSNNAQYIASINSNTIPFEMETLTGTQQLNEYIMTSLRTMEGTDLLHVQKLAGLQASHSLQKNSLQYIQQHWLLEHDNRLILTREGRLFADRIAAELFVEEAANSEM
jgi:oxygen-independent coproporphyrinogen III oxidase